MQFNLLAVIVLLVIGSWVVPGPTNKPTLMAKLVWLVPPKRLMPEGIELVFPEFCCPPLALGGPNMTKEFVPLGPGGGNVPLIPRGAGVAVDLITIDPEDGNMTVRVRAEAWALPMGIPP